MGEPPAEVSAEEESIRPSIVKLRVSDGEFGRPCRSDSERSHPVDARFPAVSLTPDISAQRLARVNDLKHLGGESLMQSARPMVIIFCAPCGGLFYEYHGAARIGLGRVGGKPGFGRKSGQQREPFSGALPSSSGSRNRSTF